MTAIGTATLKNVRSNKETLFAAIPLIFAVQAAAEGLLWLILTGKGPGHWREPLALVFLFFAYLVWPVLTPAAVYLLEREPKKRTLLLGLLMIGIGTAAYLVFFVATHPLQTYVVQHSIRYETSRRPALLLLFYLGATVAPYFVSSFKEFRYFGMLTLIFCAVSYYLYSYAFDSVWCYFAALSSAVIYILIRRLHGERILPANTKNE